MLACDVIGHGAQDLVAVLEQDEPVLGCKAVIELPQPCSRCSMVGRVMQDALGQLDPDPGRGIACEVVGPHAFWDGPVADGGRELLEYRRGHGACGRQDPATLEVVDPPTNLGLSQLGREPAKDLNPRSAGGQELVDASEFAGLTQRSTADEELFLGRTVPGVGVDHLSAQGPGDGVPDRLQVAAVERRAVVQQVVRHVPLVESPASDLSMQPLSLPLHVAASASPIVGTKVGVGDVGADRLDGDCLDVLAE